ncbi:delta 5 fatty acid desaturase [Brachionus plicatilis]|uniref:Delta 5 fatty acid desaturase n=1 Tax=Brachionus plicatilis TaxID=10195 RepID=A0A3M7T8Y6_BRAPC|nr:delta 5 fatty acid desaturase [Brachionus plicatilis]
MTTMNKNKLIKFGLFKGLCAALCCWYLITRLEPIAITDENDSISDLVSKKIKNSVTNFRSSPIIITCVAILAVDFGIFKPQFAKTVYFGFSLMDIGVGVFLVFVTGYHVDIAEYGFHWNFFFTIFAVKVLGTICESITKKSPFKCYVLSMTIGIVYQLFLMRNEFWIKFLATPVKCSHLLPLYFFIDIQSNQLVSI